MRCWLMHVNVKCHFSCKRVVWHIFARVLWTRWTATALMSRQQKQPRSTPNLAASNVRMIHVTVHMKLFNWLTSALWRWLQKTKISRFSGSSFYYFQVFENPGGEGSEVTGFFMVAKYKKNALVLTYTCTYAVLQACAASALLSATRPGYAAMMLL